MDIKIGILGLGYVGLPLAVAFAKTYPLVGFDTSPTRIADLQAGIDDRGEVSPEELKKATLKKTSGAQWSHHSQDLASCNVYIITVPTPLDAHKQPDLSLLLEASRIVGAVLSKGDTVIYESTVYPGCTEEECVPVLQEASGLVYNRDFVCGYSPERINPGDWTHRLVDIVKVTSGSTPQAAQRIDALYRSIITAGTYCAPSMKVAEAAKVIENTQRDINVALVNELAIICEKLDIDTHEVLTAAGTKWNFLPFVPGLVGGHCIGVDPYYLTYCAERAGHKPHVVLAGRKLNDGMGDYVAERLARALAARGKTSACVLILGLTFKENCPDIRNSRVKDVYDVLTRKGFEVDVHDPLVQADQSREVCREVYGIDLLDAPAKGGYDAIVLAVPHKVFCDQGEAAIRAYGARDHILFDLKAVFDGSDLRL